MGHIINPISFRVSVNRLWQSSFFTQNNYEYNYLHIQEMNIKYFLKKFFSIPFFFKNGYLYSHSTVLNLSEYTHIKVYLYKTKASEDIKISKIYSIAYMLTKIFYQKIVFQIMLKVMYLFQFYFFIFNRFFYKLHLKNKTKDYKDKNLCSLLNYIKRDLILFYSLLMLKKNKFQFFYNLINYLILYKIPLKKRSLILQQKIIDIKNIILKLKQIKKKNSLKYIKEIKKVLNLTLTEKRKKRNNLLNLKIINKFFEFSKKNNFQNLKDRFSLKDFFKKPLKTKQGEKKENLFFEKTKILKKRKHFKNKGLKFQKVKKFLNKTSNLVVKKKKSNIQKLENIKVYERNKKSFFFIKKFNGFFNKKRRFFNLILFKLFIAFIRSKFWQKLSIYIYFFLKRYSFNKIIVHICKINYLGANINIIGFYITMRLKQRFKIMQTLSPILKKLKEDKSLLGFKFSFCGRFSRKEIATYEYFSNGAVPFNTMKSQIEYELFGVILKDSFCGIKVWLNKKKEKLYDLDFYSNNLYWKFSFF
jgi:ribosomal protein S3